MLFWDIQQDKKKNTLIQEGGTPPRCHACICRCKEEEKFKQDTAPSRPTGDKRASPLAQAFNKTHFFRGEGNLGKEKGE